MLLVIATSVLPCLLLLCGGVASYPSGAYIPSGACDSMLPSPNADSGHGAAQQTGSNPFSLVLGAAKYSPGQPYNVSLIGPSHYEGFMIQARSNTTGSRVGTWQTSTLTVLNENCSGAEGKALVHKATLEGTGNMTFTWTAPPAGTGYVKFYATVVQEKEVFWAKFPGPMLVGEDPCP
ncbi:ferric-chelate reductase 1 [Lingula anatina]|uniref:Ferric-chelate reductase 1 n=1 Tax=Lingula anatina TaxID=7574 RepID=A0A1S3K6X3_LINAN|nr:ferric-chelate reductase 1 [Lingula anatina]|eukprot:XP_013418179.1 ferric-chelate reductase 1 [Lingula anatina]